MGGSRQREIPLLTDLEFFFSDSALPSSVPPA